MALRSSVANVGGVAMQRLCIATPQTIELARAMVRSHVAFYRSLHAPSTRYRVVLLVGFLAAVRFQRIVLGWAHARVTSWVFVVIVAPSIAHANRRIHR